MSYLYGAAVQGIQGFIFQTNELKDIVGASELVENICKDKFGEILHKYDPNFKGLDNDNKAVLNAAGNIKYIFEDLSICEGVVKEFPKAVVNYAPGVTISQAVVEYNNETDFGKAVDELEKKLKVQRNKPMPSTTVGLMGILRSRKTNLPVVHKEERKKGEEEYYDFATLSKRYHIDNGKKKNERNAIRLSRIAFGNNNLIRDDVALDLSDMTGSNDWLAIIHADGNGLGQVVQHIGTNQISFKNFSRKLDEATKLSAQNAYQKVCEMWDKEEKIPIRPIVLGGDDFTVICRANIALKYVSEFITEFEKNTCFEELDGVFLDGKKYLTACAGIAYVKSSYPFYYGYELAEALCTRAKTDAKKNLRKENDKMELPCSCLMFHKVQDSFVEDFDNIAARELTPNKNISFEFGPYYINKKDDSKWTVKELLDMCDLIKGEGLKDKKKANAVKSHLRNWLSLLHSNPGLAKQKLDRLKELLNSDNSDDKTLLEFVNKVTKVNGDRLTTPVYDILAIHTINTQKTKK